MRAAELRALAVLLEAPAPVVRIGPSTYSVASSRGGQRFTVSLARVPATCTCPWWRHRASTGEAASCKHVYAVLISIRAREALGVRLSA